MTGRAVAVFLVLAAVACGPGEQVDSSTSSTVLGVSTTTTPTTPDRTTTIAPRDITTNTTTAETLVEVRGGEVEGPDVVEVDLGATVDVWVLSDIDDEIHVHGYDLTFEIIGGNPFHLTFIADVPGIFEVEAHSGHTHLFELRVLG